MGKNQKSKPADTTKTKQIKSSKPKNKEMFTELKTHQENKIHNAKHSLAQLHANSDVSFDSAVDEESSDRKIADDTNNVEDICTMVHNLLAKNVTGR